MRIYALRDVLELDVQIAGEPAQLRVELLRERGAKGRYRARIWALGLWRLREGARARGEASDEVLWSDWSHHLETRLDDFAARSDAAGRKIVLAMVQESVARTQG